MAEFIFIYSRNRNYITDPIEDARYTIRDIYSNNDKDISIENVIIPCSFYNVNNSNNTFALTGTTGENVVLTNGNYTNATFITQLQTKLNASSLGVTFLPTISATTNKMSIVASSGDFSLTSDTSGNAKYLGLNESITKRSTSSTWISNNVIDLSGTNYIDIMTDLSLASSNISNNGSGLLARCWVNADPFNKIFYNTSAFNYIKLLTARLNTIHITLLDDHGNQMDLNGNNYSICLEVSATNKN